MRKRLVSWLVIAALAAYGLALIPSAEAQQPAPCPELFTDAEGDTGLQNGTVPFGGSNLDLIAGGIAAADDSSVTFELEFSDLDRSIPPGASSLNWYFHFTFNEASYFAAAEIDATAPDEVLYSYGQQSGSTLSQLGETEGSFNEGPGGTIQIEVPLSGIGAAPGATFTRTFGTARIGEVVLVATLDRGPNSPDFGSDFTVAPCAGGSPQPSGTGSPQPSASPTGGSPTPSPTQSPKPKDCKKIKNKKKRKKCKKQQKPPAPKEQCPEYVPGEQGSGQPVNLVTDEHTAEAPLELVVPTDPGFGIGGTPLEAGISHVFQNIQVDTAKVDAGLYVALEFELEEDYDLYLNYADGTEAAHAAGFNPVPPLSDGTGNGGHSEVGSEHLDGVRTPDCGGYTLDIANATGLGGDRTLKLWLGEPTYDPPAPGGGTIAALARLGIVFDD